MARARHVAWLAVLAVYGAGCGEDDSEQFRADYNRAVGRLSEFDRGGLRRVQGEGENDGSNAQVAAEFRRIAKSVGRTRSDLARLTPPERARDELDELLAALDQGSEALRAVAEAAARSDPVAADEAAENLAATSEEITEAEEDLKDAVTE